jgi:hypothetical protein
MSEPLSLERFEKFEKHIDQRFDELGLAVAAVITDVNDHMDERFNHLEQLLKVKDRVDRIEVLLAEQFGRDVLARAGL